jgi:cytochrome c oxidase cbb3-type subunit 4
MNWTELVLGLAPYWMMGMIVSFGAVVAWAYWPGNRRRFEEDGRIPFKED